MLFMATLGYGEGPYRGRSHIFLVNAKSFFTLFRVHALQ